MEKPIIGIVGRPEEVIGYPAYYIFDAYRKAVLQFGGIPILLLPSSLQEYTLSSKDILPLTESEKEDLLQSIHLCDGIIMPGGSRIYEYDLFIAKTAIKEDIPFLGTCMGMQVLGKIDCEGKIDSPLKEIHSTIDHQKSKFKEAHKVKVFPNSKMFAIIGEEEITVNSLHKYALVKTFQFQVSAISEDGIIEAIELPNKLFLLGVQWHPERILEHSSSQKIFKEFLFSSSFYKEKMHSKM